MIESSFSIEHLTNPSNINFSKSIAIYNETTPIDIKTKSNEIAYWMLNKNNKFQIYNFALRINNKIVGFAMASYLFSQNIMIYDYIALNDANRNNTVFLTFFTLIKMFFINKKIDINYYLVEISNKNGGKAIDKESLLFLKFLCLENFSRVNIEYDSLPLGLENKESSFKAFLYIKSTDDRESLKSETFFAMVNALYIDYYLKWYEPFLTKDKYNEYYELLCNSLAKLKNNIKNTDSINLLHQQCHYSDNKNKKFSDIPIINKNKKIWLIALIPIVLFLPIGIVWLYNTILSHMGISLNSANSLLGGAISAIITGAITLVTAFFANKH